MEFTLAPESAKVLAAQPSAGEPAKKCRNKLSVYQDPDLTDRLRGAIVYTIPMKAREA